jgi:hypothetical protein
MYVTIRYFGSRFEIWCARVKLRWLAGSTQSTVVATILTACWNTKTKSPGENIMVDMSVVDKRAKACRKLNLRRQSRMFIDSCKNIPL